MKQKIFEIRKEHELQVKAAYVVTVLVVSMGNHCFSLLGCEGKGNNNDVMSGSKKGTDLWNEHVGNRDHYSPCYSPTAALYGFRGSMISGVGYIFS